MHVQVAVDVVAAGEPLAQRGVARGVVAAGDQRAGRRPRARRRRPPSCAPSPPSRPRAAQPLAQLAVGHEPLELRGQRERVAGREQQPALAVADQLPVERQVARRPARPRRRAPRGRRRAPVRTPPEARQTMSAPATNSGGSPSPGRTSADPLAQPAADPRERVRRPVEPDHGLPVELVGQPAQRRAGRAAARRAPPRRSGRSAGGPRRRRVERRLARRRRRAGSARSGPGKKRSSRSAGRLVARRARVDAAEEHLDQHARHLGREHALGGLVEACATLSESEWRSAAEPGLGANGSCTWTMSNGTRPSSCSSARLTSSGIGGGRRRGPLGSGMLWPIASTRGLVRRPNSDSRVLAGAAGSRRATRGSRCASPTGPRPAPGARARPAPRRSARRTR